MQFWWNWFVAFKKGVFDTLFPCECVGCKKEGSFLCEACMEQIKLTETQVCPICSQPSQNGQVHQSCKRNDYYLNGVVIGAKYQKTDLLAKAIHRFKYQFNRETGETLAKILYKPFSENFKSAKIKLIPVPLHPKRQIWRGFNQAEILANELKQSGILSSNENIQIDNCIQRVKHTPSQAKLNRVERLQNLKGAFKFDEKIKSDFQNWYCVLIDDVYTTGTTMNECARVLKQQRIKNVWGMVVGKGK